MALVNGIEKGAACHQAEPKKISARKAQKFQLFRPIGTQCVMGGYSRYGQKQDANSCI